MYTFRDGFSVSMMSILAFGEPSKFHYDMEKNDQEGRTILKEIKVTPSPSDVKETKITLSVAPSKGPDSPEQQKQNFDQDGATKKKTGESSASDF